MTKNVSTLVFISIIINTLRKIFDKVIDFSFFRKSNLREMAKPWLALLFSLGMVFFLGALGYRITEGWDWGDCFWMVLITITTIGFGEVEPLSQLGRVITFLIIAGGIIVIQLSLQRFLSLSESGYFRRMSEVRYRRLLTRMKNHVIICGFGRVGREIAEQLHLKNIPILIIEIDPLIIAKAKSRGFKVLDADATLDETLLMAGIQTCRSLVVTLPSDAANLYVVLSAKGISNQCKLIARSATEEASNKLKLAGASVVISPYVAAGRTMAEAAI